MIYCKLYTFQASLSSLCCPSFLYLFTLTKFNLVLRSEHSQLFTCASPVLSCDFLERRQCFTHVHMHTALSLLLSAFHLPIDVKEKEKKGRGEKGEGEVDSSDTCKYV